VSYVTTKKYNPGVLAAKLESKEKIRMRLKEKEVENQIDIENK
jgi:hypothetical protein